MCVWQAGGTDGAGRGGREYTKMWGTRANRRFDGQIDGNSEMRLMLTAQLTVDFSNKHEHEHIIRSICG